VVERREETTLLKKNNSEAYLVENEKMDTSS
jgi:hypothetical protein